MGSDSSITLTAFFYYLLKNPRTYELLEDEIDTHFPSTFPLQSDNNNISYAAASKLPYLSACLQETFRLHPASAVLLERIVPASGATIGGEQIAGGTVVGVSSWAVHHDRRIFGEDCYEWRPERWLEGGEERRRTMERAMLHFGAGNHLCLGKNVSAREMWCVVPSLMRTFKVGSNNQASCRDQDAADEYFGGTDGIDESGKGLDDYHDVEHTTGGCNGEDQAKNVIARRGK